MPAGCYYEEGEIEYQHFHLQFSIYKGHVAILLYDLDTGCLYSHEGFKFLIVHYVDISTSPFLRNSMQALCAPTYLEITCFEGTYTHGGHFPTHFSI